MNIEIEGKEYTLNFGFRFLELVGEEFGLSPKVNGTEISLKLKGINLAYALLDAKDYVAINKIIRYATDTLKQKPSNKGIEVFLNGLLEESIEGEDVFEDFVEELKKNIEKNPVVRYELSKSQ